MTTMAYQIPRELERTETIQQARPAPHVALRQAAQALSRRGLAAAKAELVNHALLAYVELIFETDDDGVMPNVDTDGRLVVPAPWGRAGGRLWGLRNTEQRAFNWLMRRRQDEQNQPLFVYDGATRQWLVGRYTKRSAMAYLRTMPITLAEWREAWSATRSQWARRNLGGE